MATNRSPLLTIPGMMGPRTTTAGSSAIVAPQAASAGAAQTPLAYPGRPLNTLPGANAIVTPPPRPTNVEPTAAGPMSVHPNMAPIVDYAPQQPVDDVANSQAALGAPGGRMPQGAPVYRSPQEQATINALTYGDGTVHAPGLQMQGGTAGNSGIVPPGQYGRPNPGPVMSPAPPSGVETTGTPAPRLSGAPMASGSTMPGLPRAPTMPVNTALKQQPTTSTGLPVQRSAPTGRPAGGMFPRLG